MLGHANGCGCYVVFRVLVVWSGLVNSLFVASPPTEKTWFLFCHLRLFLFIYPSIANWLLASSYNTLSCSSPRGPY